ncbi:MAG: PQQ-dependent sugar dehydrogenase [Xanthomonadales bacterium]|nr:PQQ-dependent sugar dehydrogenase [Xanthomonadales bacterium]
MKSNKALILLFIFLSGSLYAAIPANLELQLLFSLSNPLTVRHAGDGSGRLFIIEQAGTIRIYNGTSVLEAPFLDINLKVSSGGERGLLGLDFDPDFSNNGYFYVNYTKSSPNFGDTIIERYKVSSDPNVADPASAQVIMRIDQPAENHNGGDIHFGPDGYLYIGMGDGGGSGDSGNNAQENDNLLGAILRIDVNPSILLRDSFEAAVVTANKCGLGAAVYSIPADNPFAQDPSKCGEIWAYGLRNPWRWSFDRLTGDLITADVGQDVAEEVNFQPTSSNGGENYGWRCREGARDFNTTMCTPGDEYVEPVIDLPHSANDGCSVIGGYVYRGPITGLAGLYVYSDLCGGEMYFATISAGTWTSEFWQDVGFGTTSFGEDEAGNVYMIIGNTINLIGLANP